MSEENIYIFTSLHQYLLKKRRWNEHRVRSSWKVDQFPMASYSADPLWTDTHEEGSLTEINHHLSQHSLAMSENVGSVWMNNRKSTTEFNRNHSGESLPIYCTIIMHFEGSDRKFRGTLCCTMLNSLDDINIVIIGHHSFDCVSWRDDRYFGSNNWSRKTSLIFGEGLSTILPPNFMASPLLVLYTLHQKDHQPVHHVVGSVLTNHPENARRVDVFLQTAKVLHDLVPGFHWTNYFISISLQGFVLIPFQRFTDRVEEYSREATVQVRYWELPISI